MNMKKLRNVARRLLEFKSELEICDSCGSEVFVAFENFFNQVVQPLEELPVDFDNIKTSENDVMGFVLSGGKWFPCVVMNRTKLGWVEYRVDYINGSSDIGVKYFGEWADCNVDNKPCINIE